MALIELAQDFFDAISAHAGEVTKLVAMHADHVGRAVMSQQEILILNETVVICGVVPEISLLDWFAAQLARQQTGCQRQSSTLPADWINDPGGSTYVMASFLYLERTLNILLTDIHIYE
jgi:hypothetical protein